MNVPTKSELYHLKIQAAMRDYDFGDSLKYLGIEGDGKHWYLIDNQHKVSSDQLIEFEVYDD
jgi:hypothetical protein